MLHVNRIYPSVSQAVANGVNNNDAAKGEDGGDGEPAAVESAITITGASIWSVLIGSLVTNFNIWTEIELQFFIDARWLRNKIARIMRSHPLCLKATLYESIMFVCYHVIVSFTLYVNSFSITSFSWRRMGRSKERIHYESWGRYPLNPFSYVEVFLWSSFRPDILFSGFNRPRNTLSGPQEKCDAAYAALMALVPITDTVQVCNSVWLFLVMETQLSWIIFKAGAIYWGAIVIGNACVSLDTNEWSIAKWESPLFVSGAIWISPKHHRS